MKLPKSLVNVLKALPLVALFLLSSCGIIPKAYVDTGNDLMVCRVPLEVSYPSRVYWQPITFKVLNKELLGEIAESDFQDYYIAVDKNGYENLSINMQQIIHYLEITQDIFMSFEEYYGKEDTK